MNPITFLTAVFILTAVVVLSAAPAHADTFGSGSNTFDIDFVTIGNPGNADTTWRLGKVDYTYRMAQFEISEDMINKANTLGRLGLTQDNRGANKPATSISWFEAAKFVNWLNGSTPAYKFDGGGNFQLWTPGDAGYNPNNLYRNSLAKYFLPSIDEWSKAAYYDPTRGSYFAYPTGSNTAPTPVASGTAADTAVYGQSFTTGPADITLAGGPSPYGTMGQGGNVSEWVETEFDLVNDSTSSVRNVRRSNWSSDEAITLTIPRRITDSNYPTVESGFIGFRVASIPEPSSLLLGVLAAVGLLMRRRR